MKKLLIDKLIEIGYDSQWISQRIDEWEFFNNFFNTEESEKIPIEMYIENKPTAEIPRIFLNVDQTIKSVFVLEGIIEKQDKLSLIAGDLVVADYSLDKSLCLIAFTENNKIKILKYFPNDVSYIGKNYEEQFGNEREKAINDYFYALTTNSRLTRKKIEEILCVLAQEYIIDKIIIDNSNPKIKIYDDAKEFAENITSYNYKYFVKPENIIKEIKKEIGIKVVGSGVQIGIASNNPYLSLEEVNLKTNFYLDKPSFVWISSNIIGKEELAIYSASAIYSAKTYNEWLDTREDIKLIEKAEELATSFSRQLGYQVSKNSILEVLKKLNRDMVILPTEFIKYNIVENNEIIEAIGYQFSVVNNSNEFESELYERIENYFAGMYRYQMVEGLKDNYTLIGKNINYTDKCGNNIQEHTVANFNVNVNTAILKKVIIATQEVLASIEAKNYNMLPIPTMEVIFYLPNQQDNRNFKQYDMVKFYHSIDNTKLKEKMTKVALNYITKEGMVLKNSKEVPAWVDENFMPEIEYKIVDQNGLMWEYAEMEVPSILVKEDEKNEITLVYDRLKRKVKINFVDDKGNQLKESEEAIYQVGEKFKYEEEERYIDVFGGYWRAKTLDKLNQKVFEEEEKNIINMIYKEETVEVILSFVNELGQKVMGDKIEKVQIGSTFKYSASRDIMDSTGKYWVCIDAPEEIKIEEGKTYKVSIECKALMTNVIVQYVNEEEVEVLPSITEEIQVGATYIPKIIHSWQGEDGRRWIVEANQLKEFKIKKNEEENVIKVKYKPVLVKATIQYISVDGKEIKRNEVVYAQLGSKWILNPRALIKDEKGNEWQLIDKGYKPLTIKENEKENIATFVYQVAMATVSIIYETHEGEFLRTEEQFVKQIGSPFIPMPEQYVVDNENKRWQLKKIKPAMIKVKSSDNKITVTYQPNNVNVAWQYIDVDGNEIKNEQYPAQVGSKYTPIVNDTTIQKGNKKLKLLNIEPYEITVSENEDENIVRLIYVRVSD